jgi:hypothetical protein
MPPPQQLRFSGAAVFFNSGIFGLNKQEGDGRAF